jgi:hypothetical protein
MTGPDDAHGAMRRDDFDRELADRLLGGQLDPADAPAGLGELIALVRAAGGPPTSDELGGERAIVEAMAATQDVIGVRPLGRKPVHARAIHTRAAALAALSVLGIGAVAAAVTANRAHDRVTAGATTTGPIVVTVPTTESAATLPSTVPETTPSTEPTTPSTDSTTAPTTMPTAEVTPESQEGGRGPDATGPAAFGLCTAWTAHQANGAQPNGVAFDNLDAAAAAAGRTTADYCAAVLAEPRGSGGGDAGATATATESNGAPPNEHAPQARNGAQGPPPDVPGATAPGRGRP